MLGLQGKSAKPTPRVSFSKAARPSSTMATSAGNGSRSRASSSASEKPERLSLTSRGPSPYSSKITGVSSGSGGGSSNTSRRVQSAATTRQRSALGGPTIKASELFRKNHSEPQLLNTNTNIKRGTNNSSSSSNPAGKPITKTVKHVRIDTEGSSTSLKTTLNTAANLLGIQGTKPTKDRSGSGGGTGSGLHRSRRPFSFSSDRSESVSVASNDSCSTYENESLQGDGVHGGDGDAQMIYWKKDYENNNNNNNSNLNSRFDSGGSSSDSQRRKTVVTGVGGNPRLSKRSYSMDIGSEIMDSDQDDNFWCSSPQNYQTQMIEMKIAEHPEESLREENRSSSSARKISHDSMKSQLNRTFTEDLPVEDYKKLLRSARGASFGGNENKGQGQHVKASEFDRMLLMQSDNLLQGVSDLINEIKSTETCKKQQKPPISSSTSIAKADSVEKLVADLRNDINKQMYDSIGSKGDSPQQHEMATVDERFNFNTLDLSGIELSDITCPSQVMEQSVPNTGRFERPLSAVVLGNNNNNTNLSNDIIAEAESYLLMNREKSGIAQSNNNSTDGFESSDSNNQTFSSSGALSIIQQHATQSGNSARSVNSTCGLGSGGPASVNSQHSGFDISQEEIQRKICSALKLLEEEEKARSSARRGSLTSRPATSARSQSPYMSVSNPDSRPSSRGGRGGESTKSSPRKRSEERNIPHESYDSHPIRYKGSPGGISHNVQGEGRRGFLSEPQSARSCSCITEHVSVESLNSARSSKTAVGTVGRIYNSNSDVGRRSHSQIPRQGSGGDGMWEAKDDKTKQIFSFLDEVEKSDQEMLFGLRFETDCLGRPKGATGNTVMTAGMTNSDPNNVQSIMGKKGSNDDKQFRTIDSLIRKGSVELAREILLLERKLDEAHHAVKLLEESLLNQRELNIRNLRNSERDFKKRMRMQKEEFDMAFSRNEALINEMVAEKRVLQDKFDKLIKNFEDMDEKHKEYVKSMQQKHLDEIKRLRKMQHNAETTLKKNIAGNRSQVQEIREMTVKGLEPEVQRIIQRHQQEMSEMRAWHSDEVREIEERYQRKLNVQMEDLRQKFAKEKEDLITKERELAIRRLDAEIKQKDDEIENIKRRHTNEIFEERERSVSEEMRLKDSVQESVRKAQIKSEVELENMKQDYETKLANLERRFESELKSLKDVFDAERQNWASNQMKKLEQALSEQEVKLKEAFQAEKEREWRDKERKFKEEFEKFRKDDETAADGRFRRMQDKLQSELNEMEKTEKDMKSKFSQAKTDLLGREEEVFSLKTSISMKDKQLIDLQDMNMKMQEERVNLTSVIRREFTDQIQAIEEECRCLKASIVETQSNSKLHIEQKQLEIEKIISEKDSEIEKIGMRVKQALGRKDETILELQKQLEKASFQITHLEELLEEQRKEFVHGMTKMPTGGGGIGRGHRK